VGKEKGECGEEVVVVALEEVESGEGSVPSSKGLMPWRHVTAHVQRVLRALRFLSHYKLVFEL
jgi:hypothetical protein